MGQMRTRIAVAAVVFAGLVLTGCTPPPGGPNPDGLRFDAATYRWASIDGGGNPGGGSIAHFDVTVTNIGTNATSLALHADGGYDFDAAHQTISCSSGGTVSDYPGCSWASVGSGAQATIHVDVNVAGLETADPGTIHYQFCAVGNVKICTEVNVSGVYTD
jgi:hypothetical protein